MINKFKYIGYIEDGIEGYLCLNCYNTIQLRHHYSTQVLTYCPFCGCKFDGAFIKDNANSFLYKDEDGYIRSKLYNIHEKDFKMMWDVEKKTTTYWGDDIIEENWETVLYHRSITEQMSQREIALMNLRHNMDMEKKERCDFSDKDVIEFRLVYYKYNFYDDYQKRKQIISYYYPKNNTITLTNERKKSA